MNSVDVESVLRCKPHSIDIAIGTKDARRVNENPLGMELYAVETDN